MIGNPELENSPRGVGNSPNPQLRVFLPANIWAEELALTLRGLGFRNPEPLAAELLRRIVSRQGSNVRPPSSRVCEQCGRPIEGESAFCSSSCRNRAWRRTRTSSADGVGSPQSNAIEA